MAGDFEPSAFMPLLFEHERSQADVEVTKTIAGIAVRIRGHDHIIVGKNGHASMKGIRLI